LDQRPIYLPEVRPGIEPGLRPYQGRVRPKHLQTKFHQVIADGIEPSLSWMSTRRLSRWTTRSSDQGGSRTHKHEALDLVALPVCVPSHVEMAGSGVAPDGPGL
jgi:hypothetical protein